MASLTERRNKNNDLISYKIRVFLGEDSTGKQIVKQTSFKVEPGWSEKTARKRAENFAATFEKECREGLTADARKTFEQYSEYVLDLREQREQLKPTTAARYREMLVRINDEIGYMKLKDIRPDVLNSLYSRLGEEGMNKKTGGKLSSKTILEHHRLIHTILKQAVMEGLIAINPADRVIPPKAERPEVRYFQPEEIEAIRDALEEEPIKWKAMIHLMLVTGARRGEILGLKWSDIDFTKNRIQIERNVQYTPEKGIFVDTPKTANGYRTISVPPETMQLLRELRTWQNQFRLERGLYYQNQDFLFAQDDGNPMHADSPNRWLERFSERHGLPHINPHAFRHSMASLLYFSGSDSVSISRRLGHAQVSTTANIYAHLIEQADEENAEILGDILRKKES